MTWKKKDGNIREIDLTVEGGLKEAVGRLYDVRNNNGNSTSHWKTPNGWFERISKEYWKEQKQKNK